MGVKITDRIYNEIYTEGETDWLLGNVGEWQTLRIKAEASISFFPTQQNPIQIDYIQNTLTIAGGTSWGELGFDSGMSMTVFYQLGEDTNDDGVLEYTNVFQTYTINNVFGNTMEIQQPLNFGNFETAPTNFGTREIKSLYFYVNQRPEGLAVEYTHLTNDTFENQNLNSFIDASTTTWVKENILTNFTGLEQPMIPIGLQSGMSIRRMAVIENGNAIVNNIPVYKFDIVIVFMISSFFENISDFIESESPSYLTGDGSLTDNFKIRFYPEWNNPNVLIENDLIKTSRLGNTGWFNENFNELPNDFEVESISYADPDGNPTNTLDFSQETVVTAIISGVQNLGASTECGVGFAHVPLDEDEYKLKETAFYRNVFVSSGDVNNGFSLDTDYPQTYPGGGLNGASMDIKDIRFSNVDGKIVFTGTFKPTAAFFNYFDSKDEGDRAFILYLSVADGTLERNFSDRVTLLADFQQMEKTVPQAGPYDYIDNEFLEHPLADDAIGTLEYEGFVQDDILCRIPFRIPKEGNVLFQSITFGVEAYNSESGEKFDLQAFQNDLSQFPITNDGKQQFNVDTTRGFKLVEGNNKNWVKVNSVEELDTADFFGYLAFFAFKIRWEDWIANANAPADFYNEDLENNGLHNDWFDYLSQEGWEINFFTEIIAQEDGELSSYRNRFPYIFSDYDSNLLVDTTHRYYRNSDDTLLNLGNDPETGKPLGVILANEPTRLEIDFAINDAGTWDLENTYAVITIEIDRGAGQLEMRQLSSVWESESDNPLYPLDGEDKLKLSLNGGLDVLTASCLVDPDLLEDALRYRITGRVGCKVIGQGFDSSLYEFRYEDTYE